LATPKQIEGRYERLCFFFQWSPAIWTFDRWDFVPNHFVEKVLHDFLLCRVGDLIIGNPLIPPAKGMCKQQER